MLLKLIKFLRMVVHYFNLEAELDDFDLIHESIKKDIVFKGTNLWILMFAIIVASVGLNMNSTAVIIGAMLISPLMGPINGMGYSIAIYDFPLFRQSLKNFSFAVAAGLVASTGYFLLSPISTAHSELLARTSPTIYDVLIALFGGLAGIVAISSRQKGNVIPGVAIATALMPPLCTAGYGLATFQFSFFFGAIYLFTINTVFIALSSVAISQILKFPIRSEIADGQKAIINRSISLVIVLVSFPSIYFGYQLVQKERFLDKANRYIANVSIFEGNYLLKNEVNPTKRSITLIYGGVTMNEEQKATIEEKAVNFALNKATIIIQQGLSFDAIDAKAAEADFLRAELSKLRARMETDERRADSMTMRKLMGQQILSEIRQIYPQMHTCAYAETFTFVDTLPQPLKAAVVIFTLKNRNLPQRDREKIDQWLQARLKTEEVMIFYENDIPQRLLKQ